MKIKLLDGTKIKHICSVLKRHGFTVSNKKFQIIFSKGYRTFYLNSSDKNDPFFLTTDIDLDKFLQKNYFMKTKHTKTYQDKRFNDKLDFDEATELLNWEVLEVYGIKDFDLNSTIEEPFAESMFQIRIKNSPHIILDDVVYEGEASAIMALVKPSALEALKEMTEDNILDDLLN